MAIPPKNQLWEALEAKNVVPRHCFGATIGLPLNDVATIDFHCYVDKERLDEIVSAMTGETRFIKSQGKEERGFRELP